MNKFLATFVFIIFSFSAIHAQNNYIRYTVDAVYRDSIKILEGEIVPFIRSMQKNKINIILGKDTVTDLPASSTKFDSIQKVNSAYLPQKDNLVQLRNGLVFIDATSIKPADTVTVISEKGVQIAQLINQRQVQKSPSECGKSFRLFITNTPSIYYETDNLKKYVETVVGGDNSDTQTDGVTDEGVFANVPWWYYVLFVLLVGIIGFFVWKFFFNKRTGEEKLPISKIYNGNKSLSDFANDNNITLGELLRLNKKIINQKYISYSDSDKKEVQKELKGKLLIIGYQPKEIYSSSLNNIPEVKTYEDSPKEETMIQPVSIEDNGNVSQQLQRLRNDLIHEIRQAGSKGNNSNELNKLQNELTAIKKDKSKLDSDFEQLKTDKDTLQQNFDSITAEKERSIIELNQLQEKIIAVDYLSSYCDNVLVYFTLCNKVSEDAFDFFSRLSKQNPEKATIAGLLLANYQKSINSLPVGNWVQMVQDIKETGVTNNKRIRSSFKQLTSIEEKKKQFQRMLFSEVLVRYSSSILVVAEAFSHIHRLLGSLELVSEANIFAKHVSELVNKVKPTGLENKYVPLFKNFEEFLGYTELANREKSFAYKGITDLEKDAIAEIVSYGVKTPFEDTKTLIILS